jgi:hypothetical protein
MEPAVMTPLHVSEKKGSSARLCGSLPSAVSAFCCHWRFTWITPHCLRQHTKCWMP